MRKGEAKLMSNNSSTGGYLVPSASQPLPGSLTLDQFIQTVIVGISGYDPTLVRPRWQVAPPKQPDIAIDWIAYGIAQNAPDANAYVWLNDANVANLNRMETLRIQIAFYGPNCQENIAVFRDGFQIYQNVEALTLANMGFNGCGPATHGPDLVNERWINRYEMELVLMRQVQRTYPILSFASAIGSIHTVVDGNDYTEPWSIGEDT